MILDQNFWGSFTNPTLFKSKKYPIENLLHVPNKSVFFTSKQLFSPNII